MRGYRGLTGDVAILRVSKDVRVQRVKADVAILRVSKDVRV